MPLKRLMGLYWDKDEWSSAFLNTGHTLDTFYRLENVVFFRKRLNNFATNADISGLIFLRTTTLFIFVEVDLLSVKAFDKIWNLPCSNGNIAKIVLSGTWKVAKGLAFVIWHWVRGKDWGEELCLACCGRYDIRPFTIMGTAVLRVFIIWLEFTGSTLFLFKLWLKRLRRFVLDVVSV